MFELVKIILAAQGRGLAARRSEGHAGLDRIIIFDKMVFLNAPGVNVPVLVKITQSAEPVQGHQVPGSH